MATTTFERRFEHPLTNKRFATPTGEPLAGPTEVGPDLLAACPETLDTSGRYEIQELIGAGGAGDVFKVLDHNLNRSVAIKVLGQALANRMGELQAFVNEAMTMGQLIHHPGIVAAYDRVVFRAPNQQGQEQFWHGIIMEYLAPHQGWITLHDWLHLPQATAFTLPQAQLILQYLVDSLLFSRQHGVVHRDLKPANIFINRHFLAAVGDPQALNQAELNYGSATKLSDFGLANVVRTIRPGMTNGTPPYMSPEQVHGDWPGVEAETSDVFILGSLLYEILTGQSLFGDRPGRSLGQRQVMQAVVYGLSAEDLAHPAIPLAAQKVLYKALRTDPKLRYSSLAELRAAFNRKR
jgi:eukaryotic-like serine/threonine-protein kinase